MFFVIAVITALAALFLPGPKGIIRVLTREHRAGRMEKEIAHLAFQVDSLDSCALWLSNPDSAEKRARNTFGRLLPPSDTGAAKTE